MPGRVLVVDDEPSVRFFERLSLEEAGHVVEEAGSGPEAIRMAQAPDADFAAIVLDFRMPGMTGLEAAQELVRLGAATPIVLYTAYADPALAASAEALGIEVIDKTDVERMVARVGALVDR